MPANQLPYAIGSGGPIAPAKRVIRWRGILVRDDKALPLLFNSGAEAQAEVNRLNKKADQ